uniref:RING-type domain-containing protein n=1 Tax=Myripristis murdjan TaxID=586833 RepID=A0A667XKC8_9TELE
TLPIQSDPVSLSCSHSFCEDCLQRWWTKTQMHECPVCKSTSSTRKPPRNCALRNQCEAFILENNHRGSTRLELLCGLHSEKLKLFCLDHQQPVCDFCRYSTHKGHKFRPIPEAAKGHKRELKKSLTLLQEKLKLFNKVKGNCDETAEYIKVQARRTERQIREDFKKLHQFLQEEEEARITIVTLSDTIRAVETELRAEDVSFLQNYTATVDLSVGRDARLPRQNHSKQPMKRLRCSQQTIKLLYTTQ